MIFLDENEIATVILDFLMSMYTSNYKNLTE